MQFEVLFKPAADNDLLAIYDRYSAAQAGLNSYFVAELGRVLDRIRIDPTSYAEVYRDVRTVRLRRFPYSVFSEFVQRQSS